MADCLPFEFTDGEVVSISPFSAVSASFDYFFTAAGDDIASGILVHAYADVPLCVYTQDRGATWTVSNLPARTSNAKAANRSQYTGANYIIVAEYEQGTPAIYLSTDDTTSWSTLDLGTLLSLPTPDSPANVRPELAGDKAGTLVLVVTGAGDQYYGPHILYSTDHGVTWAVSPYSSQLDTTSVEVTWDGARFVLVEARYTPSTEIWIHTSTDGVTWQRIIAHDHGANTGLARIASARNGVSTFRVYNPTTTYRLEGTSLSVYLPTWQNIAELDGFFAIVESGDIVITHDLKTVCGPYPFPTFGSSPGLSFDDDTHILLNGATRNIFKIWYSTATAAPPAFISGSDFWTQDKAVRLTYVYSEPPVGNLPITYSVGDQVSLPLDYVYPYDDTTYLSPAYTTSYISTDGVNFTASPGLDPIDVSSNPYSHEQETAFIGTDMYVFMYDYTLNEDVLLRYDGSSYSVQSLSQGPNYVGHLASNGTILIAPEGNDVTNWLRYDGTTPTLFDPEPAGETWPSGTAYAWQCATWFKDQFIVVPTNNYDGTTAAVFSPDGVNWTIDENFFTDELAYYVDFIHSPDLLVIQHGSFRITFYTYDGTTLTFRALPAEFDAVIGDFDRECKIIYDKYREVFHVAYVKSGTLYIANTTDFETYSDMEQSDVTPTTYITITGSYATPDGLVLQDGGDGVFIEISGGAAP